jgi:putative phosphoesterase
MLIGIITDTHDHLVGLQKAVEIFKKSKVEMVIHCGDWVSPFTLEFFDRQMEDLKVPVKSVVGNNPGDLKRTMMSNFKMKNPIEWAKTVMLELSIDGKNIVVYHGDDREILATLIDSQKYDVIFTGHTHASRNEVIGKTLVFNPGNTCYACEGHITDFASVGIYDSSTSKAEVIEFS